MVVYIGEMEKKKLYTYRYTRVTYLLDGSTNTQKLERDSDSVPKAFEGELSNWHRQGQLIKRLGTLSDVIGYDYFFSINQAQHNQREFNKTLISVST